MSIVRKTGFIIGALTGLYIADKLVTRFEGNKVEGYILKTHGEVKEVTSRLNELIDTYGVVTLADVNDILGITPNYIDNSLGWHSKEALGVKVRRIRNGYELKLSIPVEVI